MAKISPYLLSVLRIVAGLLFVEHGTQKLFSFPPPGSEPHGAIPGLAGTLAPYSGYFELVLGALILVGLFTRVVAFLASGEMAVAYFTAHFPHGLYPINNHGEPAVLYCFIFLFLASAGGGPIGLDWMIRKKS